MSRLDHRHNFSVYNTLLHLSSQQPSDTGFRIESLAFLPQISLSLIIMPLLLAKKDLASTMLAQTFAFVTFNKVCTSQVSLVNGNNFREIANKLIVLPLVHGLPAILSPEFSPTPPTDTRIRSSCTLGCGTSLVATPRIWPRVPRTIHICAWSVGRKCDVLRHKLLDSWAHRR